MTYKVERDTCGSCLINIESFSTARSCAFNEICPNIESDLAIADSPIIIVGGHASFSTRVPLENLHTGFSPDFDLYDPKNWILLPYQQPWEIEIYIKHILTAAALLARYPNAKAYFSGGQTRPNTPWNEADTYCAVLQHAIIIPNFSGSPEFCDDILSRAFPEPLATDSETNIAYSIDLHRQLTGNLPDKVVVISWDFKKNRFETQHFPQISSCYGLSTSVFTYLPVGEIENPECAQEARQREAKRLQDFANQNLANIRRLRQERSPQPFWLVNGPSFSRS